MNNRSWTPEEDREVLLLDREAFLERYPDRSKHGVRWRIKVLRERGIVDALPDPLAVGRQEDPADLEAYFRALERAEDCVGKLGITDQELTIAFCEERPIGLAFFSDTHIGAGGVEYGRLRADLETLRVTDGLHGVFLGDAIENTKVHSKSASALYEAREPNPRRQVAWAKSLLGIAAGKWLAFCQGNHDAFDYRAAGVDRMPDLAQALRVPYFSEAGGTLRLRVNGNAPGGLAPGEHEYVAVVKHQYGGQSKINKSNSARRLWDEWPRAWDSADIVALAHLHEPDLHVTQRRGRDVHWLRSGTYKTRDNWAEAQGFAPRYGVPVVILFPGERKLLSFPGPYFADAVGMLKALRHAA